MTMNHAAHAAPRPSRPVLPDGITFNHLIELIERHARAAFGLGLARRDALLRMMRATSVHDWTDPDRDPVCFRAQQDLAAELGITDRALRNHERQLQACGLIEIDTAADGHRSGVELAGGRRLGINFAPLITCVLDLVRLDAARQAEQRRFQALRLECSAAKRDVRHAIERLIEVDPKNAILASALQDFARWPRRYASFRSIEALEDHLQEISRNRDLLLEMLSCQEKSSGVTESQVPAILNTRINISEFCSGSSAKIIQTARKRSDDNYAMPMPIGTGDCREKDDLRPGDGRKPALTETFTPDQLYRMASDDMRLYLDGVCRPGDALINHHFVKAAITILPDLGIHPTAWDAAAETMGNLAAALTVLVIDANRFRDVDPVRKPGAMLCAMTRIAARGGLNLHGSLIRLKQWKIYGQRDARKV
ncbi:replication initiation protein RepC [Paracoccus albus]|uniref:replication initiation protein RepC n=1 Tax=Paracoccus albus TaxID=3017784 RepID=UPI0022F0EF17|nr:replication initiation protein RepC [Paracoccus albus]WBU62250.1 replication initiation protein RepC [Paracoccus albus]